MSSKMGIFEKAVLSVAFGQKTADKIESCHQQSA